MPAAPPTDTQIQSMFDRLATRYDRFNQLTSLGLDKSWRKRALSGLRPGQKVLDIGCGTGDMSFLAVRKVVPGGFVRGVDFSEPMLTRARLRQKNEGFNGSTPLEFVRADAAELPVGVERFDVVVSGFVLRNIYASIDRVLQGIRESLRPDGSIRLLDFTVPPDPIRRALWWSYLNTVGTAIGWALFGKDYPHRYLTDSAKRFIKPDEFMERLSRSGFKDIRCRRFFLGSVVLYEARRA